MMKWIKRTLSLTTALLLAFGVALPLGSFLISVTYPPVRAFKLTSVDPYADGIEIGAWLDKRWCRFIDLPINYEDDHGRFVEPRPDVTRLDQPRGATKNRRPGVQNLGPWIVGKNVSPLAKWLVVRVDHSCLLIFEVSTVLARIPVTWKPAQ